MTKKVKCIECNATSKYLWVLSTKEADFGVQFGTIRWTRYQCRKCGRVWVDRTNISDEEYQTEKEKRKTTAKK